jgi:hypothetical protein
LTTLPAEAARIDATRGRQYKLTKQHGPWMVMVASFNEPLRDPAGWDEPQDSQSRKGLTPQQAADELVYELRRKGIPAYTFEQDAVYDQVPTLDRHGRERSASYLAQRGSVCVLAGNYAQADTSVAQKTLDYIKEFQPEVLTGVKQDGKFTQLLKNGGVLRKTPGRPMPLSGAFLTINPMLSPDEATKAKADPLLLQLNSGFDNSLLQNQGKYTVVVASFYGNSQTHIGNGQGVAPDRLIKVGNLDNAAENAWELAKALRQGNFVVYEGNNPGRQQKLDAYVWHDRFRSIVTVGSFDRPDDPAIGKLMTMFKAKMRTNATTKQEFLAAEVLTIPPFPARGVPPERSWIFDPQPVVMEVPRLR